jgi:hypothetical protein
MNAPRNDGDEILNVIRSAILQEYPEASDREIEAAVGDVLTSMGLPLSSNFPPGRPTAVQPVRSITDIRSGMAADSGGEAGETSSASTVANWFQAHVITGRVALGELDGIGIEGAGAEAIVTSFENAETRYRASSGNDGRFYIVFQLPYIDTWKLRLTSSAGIFIQEIQLDSPDDHQCTFTDVGSVVVPYGVGGLDLARLPSARPARPRISGRVVDSGGECSIHCLQVLIEAIVKPETTVFRPIAVSRTDRSGRFFVDYPQLELTAARAVIPGVKDPIPLATTDKGLLAPDPLLVIDLELAEQAHESNGCGCGSTEVPRLPGQSELALSSSTYSDDLGGGCITFNTPNRAIEEFDFWTVVRTSQPAVIQSGGTGGSGDLASRSNVGDYLIEWDEYASLYQAVNVAHGHLLHFRQTWYADGYSLGDLLYSLPLAPGQKKLISVVGWERSEAASRQETTIFNEAVTADLQRNRDITEVISAALSEQSRGGSTSSTWGVGTGTGGAGNGSYQGFNFGALFGISGGFSRADSEAWQDSSRNLASTSMNSLRDRVLQSASAIRGVRSTVVSTVSESEAVRAETDVVANHNHCHALTIQYFEVLRHFQMRHDLVEVKECVFVPLPLQPFDGPKVLRWRDHLTPYLLRPDLAGAVEALRRVESNWADVSTPAGRYADETIEEISGEFELEFQAYPPPLPDPEKSDTASTALEQAALPILASLFFPPAGMFVPAAVANAASTAVADLKAQKLEERRYQKFHRDYMPRFANRFVNQLKLVLLRDGGWPSTLSADFTLVSRYQADRPLLVSFRATVSGLKRSDIKYVRLEATNGIPEALRCIVRTLRCQYATSSFNHRLIDASRLNDDLAGPTMVATVSSGRIRFDLDYSTADTVQRATPLDSWELRSPRDDDRRLSVRLIEHMNANLEYYHHAIWWTMDPNRRYLLLDGFLAPNGGGRSIAQVVENKLIGIVGNSLVLPVAPGNRLDPLIRLASTSGASSDGEQPATSEDRVADPTGLLAYYAPPTPAPPARISLPTKGVFAEAVMGACNACERIDDSRFWRWEQSPLDEPPAIEPASTASRESEPPATSPTQPPTPIVSIQNAPAAPEPTDLGKIFELLGKEVFRDLTGLAGTQAAAAATYKQNLDTALAFGKEASELAKQAGMLGAKDKAFSAIDSAEQDGKISSSEAHDLRLSALQKLVGDAGSVDADVASAKKRLGVVNEADKSGVVDASKAKEVSGTILENLASGNVPRDPEREAAAKKINQMPSGSVSEVDVKHGDNKTRVQGGGASSTPTKSRVATMSIWINAFIPKFVEGITQVRPGHPNETVVHGLAVIGDCFATDNRTFSTDINASSRMHSEIKLDLSGVVPGVLEYKHRCDESIEYDCEDGDEEGRAKAAPDRMKWSLASGRTDGLVQLTYRGAASNPLVTGSSDIDMYGTVLIEPSKRELRFVGGIDDFPAFEMYCRADDGPILTVFRAGPVPGVGPAVGLAGDARRAIDETVNF